jgi:hypothetical protein
MGVFLGVIWSILDIRLSDDTNERRQSLENTNRPSIAQTIRRHDTETKLEQIWDLIPPAHRQIGKSVNLPLQIISQQLADESLV